MRGITARKVPYGQEIETLKESLSKRQRNMDETLYPKWKRVMAETVKSGFCKTAGILIPITSAQRSVLSGMSFKATKWENPLQVQKW